MLTVSNFNDTDTFGTIRLELEEYDDTGLLVSKEIRSANTLTRTDVSNGFFSFIIGSATNTDRNTIRLNHLIVRHSTVAY